MLTKQEIKRDVYLQTAVILQREVLNDYASSEGFIDEAQKEQDRLADELIRRAYKLQIERPASN